MYKLKSNHGRVNALLLSGKDFVKTNLSISASQHIISTGTSTESDRPDYPICVNKANETWYFEGEEVKKKVKASSTYGEMKGEE